MTVLQFFKSFLFLTLLSTSFPLLSLENTQGTWNKLQNGNTEFVRNKNFADQRAKVAEGQNPSTIVLSCSDSRVTPEYIFDQRLGQLFISRVAGNVVDDVVVDSIEYAVAHFDVSTIVVMGHTNCGAVIGALDRLRKNQGKIDALSGHLNAVLIPIEKAILAAKIDINAPNALELSTRANILYSANQLIAQSPAIAKALQEKRINIVGSEYNLKTGEAKKLFVLPQ